MRQSMPSILGSIVIGDLFRPTHQLTQHMVSEVIGFGIPTDGPYHEHVIHKCCRTLNVWVTPLDKFESWYVRSVK